MQAGVAVTKREWRPLSLTVLADVGEEEQAVAGAEQENDEGGIPTVIYGGSDTVVTVSPQSVAPDLKDSGGGSQAEREEDGPGISLVEAESPTAVSTASLQAVPPLRRDSIACFQRLDRLRKALEHFMLMML